MYLTTSKTSSKKAKIVAKTVAQFTNSIYENRGKKTIEEIFERARKLGKTRAIIISEREKEFLASFIKIGREWGWMAEITFSIKNIPEINKERKEVLLVGKEKDFEKLFDYIPPKTDDVVEVRTSKREIKFSYGKKILNLKLKGIKWM